MVVPCSLHFDDDAPRSSGVSCTSADSGLIEPVTLVADKFRLSSPVSAEMLEGMEPNRWWLSSSFREVKSDSADRTAPGVVPYTPLCDSSIAVTCPCSHTILGCELVLEQSQGVNSVNLNWSHRSPCHASYNWLIALHSETTSVADLPLHGVCDGEGWGPGCGDGL